jgi:hypothetical protein
MAVVDVIMSHRTQIFISGILIEAIRGLLPANLIVKITNLMLDFTI